MALFNGLPVPFGKEKQGNSGQGMSNFLRLMSMIQGQSEGAAMTKEVGARNTADAANDWMESQGFQGTEKYPNPNKYPEDIRARAYTRKNQNMISTLRESGGDEAKALEIIKLHPEWGVDPDTAPNLKQLVGIGSQMADIRQKTNAALINTIESKTKLDAMTFGTKQKALANKTLLEMSTKLGDDPTAQAEVAAALEQSLQPDVTASMMLAEAARIGGKYSDKLQTDKAQSTFGKLLADRAGAQAAGKAEEVKLYDQQIAAQGRKQGFKIQFDDQGRAIINYGPGAGDSTIGDPTVATQSGAQRKLLKYEAATELMNHLQRTIKPEYLGVRGSVGEIVVDRGLSQLVPEMADKSRVDFRSSLIAARESLLREISDDTRFSNVDREEIAKALPSSGIFESLPDAQQRLDTVRRIITQRGKTYSDALGLPAPMWSLSKEEIKKQFDEKKITQEQAIEALERFH